MADELVLGLNFAPSEVAAMEIWQVVYWYERAVARQRRRQSS